MLIASDRPRSIVEGFAKGTVPPRYEGGIGDAGVRALDTFKRGGGTIVCLNSSSDFAIEALHLPVKNASSRDYRAKTISASGSILEIVTDPSHLGDGGDAGSRARIRRRQPGLHDARRL